MVMLGVLLFSGWIVLLEKGLRGVCFEGWMLGVLFGWCLSGGFGVMVMMMGFFEWDFMVVW